MQSAFELETTDLAKSFEVYGCGENEVSEFRIKGFRFEV